MLMELMGEKIACAAVKKGEAGRKRRHSNCAEWEEAMNDLNNDVPKFVTRARASYLLGIPQEDLRRISEESGLGHLERAGNEEVMYFTYEELRRICQLASPLLASL
jgi:hypothetical protein